MRPNLSPDEVAVLRVLAGSVSDMSAPAAATVLGWPKVRVYRALVQLEEWAVSPCWVGHWCYRLTLAGSDYLAAIDRAKT